MTPRADLTRAAWRKSSHSDANGGACVEVADLGGPVAVRDSKDPDGTVLRFPRQPWSVFVAAAKAGAFDPPH